MTKATLKKQIIEDKNILGGVPVFKGTRIPVAQVFALMSRGMKEKEIINSYPITKKQINVALNYAANEFNGIRK